MLDKLSISGSALLDRVLDCASIGLFVIDSDGLIIYCNSLLEKLVGTTAQELLGESYTALLDRIAGLSTDPQQTLRDMASALKHLDQVPTDDFHPTPHQLYLSTNDSSFGRLQVRFFPFAGASDRSWMWSGVLHEVSQEWYTLVQQARYLSRVIKELRISFAETAGSIAPLLVNHSNWDVDERHYFLQSLSERMEQQKQVLANVHDLFKLELGELSVNRRPTAIRPLIDQAIQSLGLQPTDRHFNVVLPNTLPRAAIDPGVAERIFRNILASALQHIPPETIIQITAEASPDEVIVHISNPAIALEKEEVQHFLEPFYSAGVDSRAGTLGYGLELYTAQQFITASGGRIWAEHVDQIGTVVHCAFPLKDQRVQTAIPVPPASPSTKPKLNAQPKTRPANVRAMLVEDDRYCAEMLRMMLTRAGYQPIIANSGQHALELAYDEPPEIILMDLHMPGLDGFALTTQFREALAVPIIALTADSRRETRMRALSLGVDDYLTKPVDSEELLARIRNILQRASGRVIGQRDPSLRIGNLYVDLDRRQVSVDGQTVKLTPMEFRLLHVLARNADRTLSHEQLLKAVWGPQYGDEKQYLWVHINRLRQKLAKTPSHTEFIVTEPGVGYRLHCPAEV